MNFGQRLFRYLIGVTIGCALVYMMFPNYNWLGWTPENQIMKNIRESSVSMGSKANCQMACLGIGW
ncbi:MAG: hypothetical protein IT223_00565 [Crocinitomicaceae bacterium]|nr:hypothetical protein [Crocinitomicaceae bacterium]